MPRPKKRKYEKQDAQRSTIPDDMNALPRAAQALRLRRMGYTYAEIAAQVGYANESGARKAIKVANERIVRDDNRALVGWQLDQIDMALTLVMRRIQRNDEYSLFAVDRLTPLLKRQAELMGLDVKPETQMAQMTVIPIAADVLEAV